MTTIATDVVLGTGAAAFAYNRGNYLFDVAMRWDRFVTGYEFAMSQTGMYRKDLRKLTELTTKKTSTYAVVASLCLALCIANFCAGRLGLHGASPPGWIMGLWYTNTAAAFCYMGLTIWLALHANLRCQAATVQLLTRMVRLPVPTMRQMDKARRFASEFEQQSFADIFRIPYLMNTGVPKDSKPDDPKPANAARARARSAPVRKRNLQPTSWVRDEWDTDRAGVVTGPEAAAQERLPDDVAPEHFKLYAQAQKEWWPFDVYSRICLLYGFLSFIHGLCYYALGHINVEARAFFAAYSCAGVLAVLHFLIVRFDIISGRRKGREVLKGFQFLGPAAVLPAAIAMSLDFRVEYDPVAVAICFIFQFISYGMQILYTMRLFEIVLPDECRSTKMEERIGFAWWPDTWKVPTTFMHVLYLVAPPQRLQPGQYDLVREMKEGRPGHSVSAGGSDAPAGGASTSLSAEDLQRQAQYVDQLFQWVYDERVWNVVSSRGQTDIRKHFMVFSDAKTKTTGGPDPVFAKTLRQCLDGVQGVIDSEPPLRAKQQGGGGAGGGGGAMSGSEGSGGESPRSVSSGGSSPAASKDTAMYNGRGGRNDAGASRAPQAQPWQLVSSLTFALLVAWVVMALGTLVEVFIGEQALVTAPHWSRPPMTRPSLEPHEVGTPFGFTWPAGARPFLPEQLRWHEEKRGLDVPLIGRASGYPGQGNYPGEGTRTQLKYVETSFENLLPILPETRRLAAGAQGSKAHQGAQEAIQGLFGALPPLVLGAATDMMRRADAAVVKESVASKSAKLHPVAAEHITWPSFFEPKVLACGSDHGLGAKVAAISTRGFGAVSRVGHGQDSVKAADPFRLAGLTHLAPILAASFLQDEELLLVTRAGELASCPGPVPESGGWACAAPLSLPTALPVGKGARLAAAAAAWLRLGSESKPQLHAAFVDERAPDLVALYVHEQGEGEGVWMPLGEVPLPQRKAGSAAPSLAFVDGTDLLVATGAGDVVRRRLADGSIVAPASTDKSLPAGAAWQAACGIHGTSVVAHLSLRENASATRRPEVSLFGVQSAPQAVVLE
mmetsp:Transcript_7159/g.15541  ORF Transcript_7159/g.15541 Transcript_7159/m.15541 type:complete len:1063 (-) Transcript_7159:86-3274(-)